MTDRLFPMSIAEHGEAFATLVVHELNVLCAGEKCCADCCAPCAVLRRLAADGDLEAVIQLAPAHLYDGSDWWVDGRVDRAWLTSRWGCQSNPTCCDRD